MRSGAVFAVALAACAHAASPVAPAWQQRFVEHDGVRIEYLVRGGDGEPVLLVPGFGNAAQYYVDHAPFIAALGHHPLVAISLRGRGASSSPEHGWTVEAQASDIAAVVDAEHLARVHLVSHSMGVPPALSYALAHTANVASFTAADYWPGQPAVTLEWAARVEADEARPGLDRRIARRMVNEQPAEYWPDLTAFPVPVLAVLSSKTSEPLVEERWKKAPHARVQWIDFGHQTFEHDGARKSIASFIGT